MRWNCFLDTSTGRGGGEGGGGGGQGGGGQGIDPCEEGEGTLGPVLSGDGTGKGTEGGQDAPGEDGF